MKKSIFFGIMAGFMLFLLSACYKEYHEYGYDTFVYYINGEYKIAKTVVGSPYRTSSTFEFFGDSSGIHTAILSLKDKEGAYMSYEIQDFNGPGLYSIDNGKLRSAHASYQSRFDYRIPSGDCYVRVLEWEPRNDFISAVFQSILDDPSGHTIRITRGRIHMHIITDTSYFKPVHR